MQDDVASALINELKKPGVYESVNTEDMRLKNALTELLHTAEIPAVVLGEPTAFQPWLIGGEVFDHRSSLALNWKRHFKLQDLLLDRGVLKGQEKFFISTEHSDAQIDHTIAALADLMEELKAT